MYITACLNVASYLASSGTPTTADTTTTTAPSRTYNLHTLSRRVLTALAESRSLRRLRSWHWPCRVLGYQRFREDAKFSGLLSFLVRDLITTWEAFLRPRRSHLSQVRDKYSLKGPKLPCKRQLFRFPGEDALDPLVLYATVKLHQVPLLH